MSKTITKSFSLDKETVEGIEKFAREQKMSNSDAVRHFYYLYKLQTLLLKAQEEAAPLARKLGIKSEDDVEKLSG